jgi:glycosyltransferase involved in cell wall biosynthesis
MTENKIRVCVVGTVGVPAKYGGFETLVEYLIEYIGNEVEFVVFCSSKIYDSKPEFYKGAKLRYINLFANGIQSILYDIVSLIKSRKSSDIILILGTSGCIALPVFKRFTKARIVVNVDGIEWRRDKWGRLTKAFLRLSERMAVRYADQIVADNQEIRNILFKNYNKDSNVIAYGGCHVKRLEMKDDLKLKFPFLSKDYVFKVCRIEPENNIELILEAFTEINFPIVIVGNWNNSEHGKELFKRYSKFEHVHLLDPIYEREILDQLRSNCCLYIHGHSAGGTNPSLVEAMYLKLPIIAFDVKFNRITTNNEALYFKGKIDLVNLFRNIRSEELDAIADKMYHYAKENYTWKKISNLYLEMFDDTV